MSRAFDSDVDISNRWLDEIGWGICTIDTLLIPRDTLDVEQRSLGSSNCSFTSS